MPDSVVLHIDKLKYLIEEITRDQSSNPEWFKQKSFHVTASNFGQICKLRQRQI